MTRVVAVVQARLGSTRLPGKVLLPLLGAPMLSRVMGRVARAQTVTDVILATTDLAEDDPLIELAGAEGWPAVRGSATDLLDRYLLAAHERSADVVVRITSDCPLIDPGVIDLVVAAYEAEQADYASNTLPPRTFPRGLDVEVIGIAALERAGREDADPAWREHATPYIYRHPERFRLAPVAWAQDHSEHRWTVDTQADYELVRTIYERLGRDDFTWLDALGVVEANPEWGWSNHDVVQKQV